jgi:hypothetical protein
MKAIVVIAIPAMIVSGCASTPAPVAIDTFCLTAKKRTWSINDTAETIRDAEAWNKLVDIRCGVPGRKA